MIEAEIEEYLSKMQKFSKHCSEEISKPDGMQPFLLQMLAVNYQCAEIERCQTDGISDDFECLIC